MFKVKKIENFDVYYSDFLENENIEHFFTSRNLIVKENSDLVAEYLNIKSKNLIHPNQTHSDNIELVKEDKFDYPNCDSLILNNKNKAIYLNFADCTPIILYDKKNKIASIAHAGWRGAVQKIAPKTVLKMKDLFNTNPNDIIAVIGPCISFQSFETSADIINQLKKTIKNNKDFFTDTHADLKNINKTQLNEIGVNIVDICPYCTVIDNDKFFSYRKENATKNRHSAVVKLK